MYLDLEMVIGNLLLLLMRVAVETTEATIVRVCPQRGLLGQMQFVLDLGDQFFPFQDASSARSVNRLVFESRITLPRPCSSYSDSAGALPNFCQCSHT